MKIIQEDVILIKNLYLSSSIVHEGCWGNCATRVGNFEASTVCWREATRRVQLMPIPSLVDIRPRIREILRTDGRLGASWLWLLHLYKYSFFLSYLLTYRHTHWWSAARRYYDWPWENLQPIKPYFVCVWSRDASKQSGPRMMWSELSQ